MKQRNQERGARKYGYQPPIRIRDRRDHAKTAAPSLDAPVQDGVIDGTLLPKSLSRAHARALGDKLVSGDDGVITGRVGLGQSGIEIQGVCAEADTPAPLPRRTRARKAEIITPVIEATALDATIVPLRRHLYEWRQFVSYRVATINRLRAMCRSRVVDKLGLDPQVLHSKGEEIKRLKLEKDYKIMQSESGDLYDSLMDGTGSHKLTLTMINALPLVEAIKATEASEKSIEQEMAKIAKRLPVAAWAEAQWGFSMVGLAKIIGYAGDLNRFCDETTKRIMPSKLWKFMELAVIDGNRQRRVTGDAALIHKYKGHKRSLMWNIGCSLIGGMGRGPRLKPGEDIRTTDLTRWQKQFYEHMRFYADRNKDLHRKEVGENGKESFSKHAWSMSKRRVEKEFLAALQDAWHEATQPETPA